MPIPSAAFSPFTTHASTSSSERSCGQALLQRPPSGGADDVGDEQDAQGRGLYGTPKVADGNTWMATLFPPSVA